MSREHLRPPMHGRDHLPGGSDPIPGVQTSNSHAIAFFGLVLPGSVTVASGAGVNGSLRWLAGDSSMVDLTAPATPTIKVQGLYCITVTFSSTGSLWTSGATFQAELTAQVAGLTQNPDQWSTVTIGTDLNPRQGFVALSSIPMAVNDTFTITLLNHDSSSRDLTCDQIVVTRILSY